MLFQEESIFGEANITLNKKLKNPNQYREAVLFEALNSLPDKKKKEFIRSLEGRMMIKEEMIPADTLERLANDEYCGPLNVTVCHMAKENGDPLWDELVQHRAEERRILNDLLAKYGEEAKPVAEAAQKEIIDANIPKYFKE